MSNKCKKYFFVVVVALFNTALMWFLNVIWISWSLCDRWGFGFGHVTDFSVSVCVSHGLWVFDLTSGLVVNGFRPLVIGQSVGGVPADGWTQRGRDTRLLYWGWTANSLTSTSSSGHLLLIIHTCTHAKHTTPLSNAHTSADLTHLLYI